MKCYFDGSGDGRDASGDDWITLGGVAATDAAWADFDQRWSRMLRERYPVAPYVHMIEVMGHDDPFTSVNGWDLAKKRRLILDAIIALSQMDKNEFRWFRISINEGAVRRLFQQGEAVPADLHKHCSLLMVTFMLGAYIQNCPNREKIFLFFDRGEKFMSGIKTEWLARRTPRGRPLDPNNFWWDTIENIADADQAFTPPLQVSDMVAWSHTRTLPADEQREFSDLKAYLIKFVPSTNLDITEDVIRAQSQIVKNP